VAERSLTTFAIWAVVALLGAFALLRFTGGGRSDGSPVRIDAGPDSGAPGAGDEGAGGVGGSGTGGSGAGAGSGAAAFVHVAGAVRRPGVVRVPAGARVATAVGRAGGATPKAELSLVNLAARVEDGQQVVVPARGTAAVGGPGGIPPGPGGAAGPGAGAPKLSLGAATVDQLDELDGIGPTLSERIVEYRTENGGFRSLDELKEVEGIGEKRFESLREAVQP
jgi:competence protein ComEA